MPSESDRLTPLKRALITIERLERDLSEARSRTREPIAIVGMACRFPSASSPTELWSLLRAGGDAVRDIPADRWDAARYFDPDPEAPGKTNSVRAGLLDQVDRFDPAFFGISADEAEALDPQQRWTLEVAWEAFEDAGRTRESLAGSRVAVMWGAYSAEYLKLGTRDAHAITTYTGTGGALNLISGRVAYAFDLVGPNLTVDTACSSSLMAVHLAIASLRRGECDLALAGGVNAILTPEGMIAGAKLRMFAPDGHCKVFDARADGFVRGEGCGGVVLSRLSDALDRGDRIHAVLLGSATNQDGRSNGLTAPNVLAQEAVIRAALEDAGVDAGDVGYVEAHGTGTALGDPVEVEGLRRVFGAADRDAPLRLGAVKANLGHLESAAGIAGLIKTALVVGRGEVPPQIHFERPNPHAALDASLFEVPADGAAWPRAATPRLAGVSSFGWSGSNVHVVVAEWPGQAPDRADADGPHLVPLSAHSERALQRAAERLARWDGRPHLARVSRTRACRRSHLEHRLAVVADDWDELARGLRAAEAGASEGVALGRATRPPRIAYVFPGQGSQWVGMGHELARRSAVVRETLDEVDAVVRRVGGWSLLDELRRDDARALARVDRVQPAVFALQLGLARLWQRLGIAPDAVVGHSMGELAAAHVAGAMSVEDAASIVCERGRVIAERAPPGGMLVVPLPVAEVEAAIGGHGGDVAVAAENTSRATLVSGSPAALAAFRDRLERRDVTCRELRVDYPSHGPAMDALLAPLRDRLGRVRASRVTVPFWSTVSGARVEGPELDADYWARNLRSPVRFWPVVDSLAAQGVGIFLEISPNEVLARHLEASLVGAGRDAAAVPSVRRSRGEWRSLLEAIGQLYAAGGDVTWSELVDPGGPVAELPPYAWDRERYWREPGKPERALDHAVLSRRTDGPALDAVLFEGELDPTRSGYLEQHRVFGVPIVPGVLWVELAVEAAQRELGGAVELFDVVFEAPLRVERGGRVDVQVTLRRAGEDEAWRFQVHARPQGEVRWRRHAVGGARPTARTGPASPREETATPADPAGLYERLEATGLEYGPLFRGLEACGRRGDAAYGEIVPPERLRRELGGYRFHPALLDACLHPLALLLETSDDAVSLPVAIERVQLAAPPRGPIRSSIRVAGGAGSDFRSFDAEVADADGAFVARLSGIGVQRTDRAALERATHAVFRDWQYAVAWEEYAPAAPEPAPGRWLVVGDGGGVGERLARALREAGHEVERTDGPDAGPAALDAPLQGVVQLTALDARGASGPERIAAANRLGSECARDLLVRLADRAGPPPTLWLATAAACRVGESDEVAPEQASLRGFLRSARNELPDLCPRALDLPADPSDRDLEVAAACVRASAPEDEVAVRDAAAWRPRLRPWRPPAAADQLRVRDDSWYLVTGGFGGIGRALAAWLVDRGARHVALAGRRGAAAPEARATVEELAARGCEVLELRADVSDALAVERALATVRGSGRPIRGVLHAAAVLDDGVLVQQRAEHFARVFEPKALGAWHLHELTRADPLDFFALFSSAAAVLGSRGQSGYAAANEFLDALAAHRRQRGLAATSIEWGAWAEMGLAAGRGEPLRERLEAGGMGWLAPGEGLAILESALAGDAGVLAVLPIDWDRYAATLARLPDLLRECVGTPAAPRAGSHAALRRALASAPESERRRLVAHYVRGAVAELLGSASADALGSRDGLFELGLDSLRILDLRARIREDLGIGLPVAAVFGDPSLSGVTDLACRGAPDRPGATEAPAPDVRLDPGIAPRPGGVRAAGEGPILLTGATGFVGAHLLRALVERTGADVECLVRARDAGHALRRLRESQAAFGLGELPADRVRCHAGDVSLADLGLGREAYGALADRAGEIHHGAAIVNFALPYAALRAANVAGTEEVLRLAVRGRTKRVHFVSSIGALDGHVGEAAVHEADEPSARGFKTGYARSKWAAERLVLEAASRGLPAAVYRLAEVGPSAKHRIWNPNDFTYRLLRACLEVGAYPDVDFRLNLIPVDAVAEGFVALATRGPPARGVFHLVETRPIGFRELVAHRAHAGLGLVPIDYERWRAAVATSPGSYALEAVLPATAAEFAERVRLPEIGCDETRRALGRCGVPWPPSEDPLDALLHWDASRALENPS